MMRRIVATIVFLVTLLWAAAGAMAGGMLFGTVGLTDADGTFTPGAMIRVYLVRQPIPLPALDEETLTKLPPLERILAVNDAQMAFFKAFREKATDPHFIAAQTVTSRSGTFTFRDIAAGRYFVVVTFPSIIKGKKVTWAVPVNVAGSGYRFVHLDTNNLALPTAARNEER